VRQLLYATASAIALTVVPSAHAQWQLQTSNTTADLRGIHNVGNGVAWASGTNGTVLRTEDGGYVWQTCSIPPGAEKLDFRGIQAFDAATAIVMSSGKGDLSRLYKTIDGCHTWKLVFTNPDPDGFWDGLVTNRETGFILGDPVNSHFVLFTSEHNGFEKWDRHGAGGKSWLDTLIKDSPSYDGEGMFAASNSSARGSVRTGIAFVTGGRLGAQFAYGFWTEHGPLGLPSGDFAKVDIPLAKGKSAGAFSFDCDGEMSFSAPKENCFAVGGDYLQPDSSNGTAAHSFDRGAHWTIATTPPHGYRSSVAYDPSTQTWVTVGPNGTDISVDDGKNWRPIHPDAALHEAPDADRNWNALSLPYVVGPHGRIGKLDPAALK